MVVHPDNGLVISPKKKWSIKLRKDMKESKMYNPGEKNQYEKAAYYMIPTIWNSGKGRTMRTVKDQWVPGVRREGGVNSSCTEAL